METKFPQLRAFFQVGLAACIKVYEERVYGPWPNEYRVWDLHEGSPAIRMLLAMWLVTIPWGESSYISCKTAAERIRRVLLHESDGTSLEMVASRLRKTSRMNMPIAYVVDEYTRKGRYRIRSTEDICRYLDELSEPVLGRYADRVGEKYAELLGSSKAYLSALESWAAWRNSEHKSKTPET